VNLPSQISADRPVVHGQQRLWRVSEALRGRALVNVFSISSPLERLLIESALFLVRQMVLQGRAIATIVELRPAEAAYTNLRSLFEHYIDYRYLLTGEEREQQEKAFRIQLYTRRDLTSHVEKLGGFDAAALQRMGANQQDLARLEPGLAAEFEADWRQPRKRGHWSGKTRSEVMRVLDRGGDALSHRYKVYSWRAHPLIGLLTDVSGNIQYSRIADPLGHDKTGRFIVGEATGMLLDAWRGLRSQRWYRERQVVGSPEVSRNTFDTPGSS
jgi:hypothetical protein